MRATRLNYGNLKILLIVSIYFSALSLFALQVRDVCIKYFEKRTTISISQEILEEVLIPIITLCSGYKISQNIITEALLHNDTFGSPSMFDNAAFKLGRDFRLSLTLWRPSKNSLPMKFFLENGANSFRFDDSGTIDVKVTEIRSITMGLCYVIEADQGLKNTEAADFRYIYSDNVSYPDAEVGFKAIVSNKTENVAILYDDWKGFKGITIDLQPGYLNRLGLVKVVNIFLEEKNYCQLYGDGESRPQCRYEKLSSAIRVKILESCPNPCIIPALESALMISENDLSSDWKYCQNYTDATCIESTLTSTIYSPLGRNCRRSCAEVVYKGNKQQTEITSENGYGLLIFFDSMTQEVNTELLLFDFSSFVGNFGGSLGLFIGFSYLDFWTKITRTLIDYLSFKRN